ncbi:hypothetical protein PMAYCL1PPCAC_05649, partial [Pristionchus mayeri]
MPFRVSYWIPILIILFISTAVHVRLLIVVLSNIKQPQYSSFFFKMFISQSIIEISLVYAYVVCEMILKDLLFGEDFALSTGYIYPKLAYYGCYYYTVHVQAWGVVMFSINRCVIICAPFSKLGKLYERINTPTLWLLNITVPFLIFCWMLFQVGYCTVQFMSKKSFLKINIEYTYRTNSMQGAVVSIVGSAKSATKDYRREVMLTLVGFALFIALCFSTLFYVLLAVNAATVNWSAVVTIRTYYIYPLMALTFVNPWMLLITNKNTRKRMLFQRSDISS